jgi:hypothetical protein
MPDRLAATVVYCILLGCGAGGLAFVQFTSLQAVSNATKHALTTAYSLWVTSSISPPRGRVRAETGKVYAFGFRHEVPAVPGRQAQARGGRNCRNL